MNQVTPIFVAISNTYTHLDFALYKGTIRLDYEQIDNKHSSKLFIPLFDALLTRNNLTCLDLSFLAVNTGPGPFTTLRTVIASVNGIAFGSGIPLLGVDGLMALVDEHSAINPKATPLLALLNAFNNEVYYALVIDFQLIEKGYKKIDAFGPLLAHCQEQTIDCIGNGALLHKEILKLLYGPKIRISSHSILTCTIQQIAYNGLQQWNNSPKKQTELQISYLKTRAW